MEITRMNMLSAKEVQNMLNVPDLETVAYGYTLDRRTVNIWFEDGKLVRHSSWESGAKHTYENYGNYDETIRTEEFDPNYFKVNMKRFYEDRTNSALVILFATFGSPLPLVKTWR
jgi:hypothetical protein